MLRQIALDALDHHINKFPTAAQLGNSSFQAVSIVQLLSHIAKLLATTTNFVFCLCVVLAGSDTSIHTQRWH